MKQINKNMKQIDRVFTLLICGLIHLTCTQAQTAFCPSYGPYFEGKNIGANGKGEVIYSEVMADSGCMEFSTYWSTLNFNLGGRGGYAGIQYKQSGERNNIFSIWDLQDTHTPQCTAEYSITEANVGGFGGEGTGLHTDHVMNWTPEVWYATVVRRWYTGDDKTRVGFFMYDHGTRKWTHYITLVAPEKNSYFQGNGVASFLENFNVGASKAPRCGYYRGHWRMNSDNVWSKPSFYEANAGTGSWSVGSVFSNTAVKVISCGTTPGPVSALKFTLDQPGTKPSSVITAEVTVVSAVHNIDNTVTVNWIVNASKSPQLSYTIKLYNNISLTGTPIAVKEGIRPEFRTERVSLPSSLATGTYYISMQVKDIFNELSNIKSTSFTKLPSTGNGGNSTIDTSVWYKIKNVKSKKYLSIKDKSLQDGALIIQDNNGAGNELIWKLSVEGNSYVLTNGRSTKAIDLPGAVQTSGTKPIQYTPHKSINQQWNLVPTSNNSYLIQTNMSDHYVIQVPANSNASGVEMNIAAAVTVSGNANQQWILEPVGSSNSSAIARPLIQVVKEGLATSLEKSYKIGPNPLKIYCIFA